MNLRTFHRERPDGEEAEHSNQCFAIRNVVHAIHQFTNLFDAEMTVYDLCYPHEIHEAIVSLLHTKSNSFFHPPSSFSLPNRFPDRFHNPALTKTLRYKVFAFENGQSLLLIGEKWSGLTQIGLWTAGNYSEIRSKDSAKESFFCFIYTRETPIADWIGHFIAIPRADVGRDLMARTSGPFTDSIMKGYFRVVDGIDSAPANIDEKLNAILIPNESEGAMSFAIPENKRNPTVEFNSGFWFLATFALWHLEALLRALFYRFSIVWLDDQIIRLPPSENKVFISHVHYSPPDPDLRSEVPRDFGALPDRFGAAWLTRICPTATAILPDCERIAAKEAVSFVRRLFAADSRFKASEGL
jgi:hypothetical protein